jgi:hypothetical protein
LPSIANKTKHKVEKYSCKNSACSQPSLTWQTDAVGLQKCDLGLLLIIFHPGSYNNNSLGTCTFFVLFWVIMLSFQFYHNILSNHIVRGYPIKILYSQHDLHIDNNYHNIILDKYKSYTQSSSETEICYLQ